MVEMAGVRDREMGGGPVVPERDTSRGPAESHRVLGAGCFLPQQIQDRFALRGRIATDLACSPGESRADEQRTLTGHRMHPHRRVIRHQIRLEDLALALAARRRAAVELMLDV